MVPVLLLVIGWSWPAPGDGLSLEPEPVVERAARPVAPQPPIVPAGPGAAIGAGAAAAGWMAGRRRPGRRSLTAPSDLRVVFVSGHGSAHQGEFDRLVGLMGLRPEQVEYYDHRWSRPGDDHRAAARNGEIDSLAVGLQGYLAGLGEAGRPIYVIGYSLGGVTIAELLARWDEVPALRVGAVQGAALLDPPMADGLLGWLQSRPRLMGFPGHDGGYDPVAGTWPFGRDRRVNLGRPSGVSVVVFRNPEAGVTNLWDRPEGLRVFDVHDRTALLRWYLKNPKPPFGMSWLQRISMAHRAVLANEGVARCIVAEMHRGGSCRAGEQPGPGAGGGGSAW